MPLPHRRIYAVCALACLAGCGYVGEPQYPALNIPNRALDLSVVERGDHLDINFTIPPLTTEGLALTKVGPIDLRVGPAPSPEFHIEPWAEAATRFEVPSPGKPAAVRTTVPVQKFIGQTVIVAVRVENVKGRVSEWSNLAEVRVEAPLGAITDLTAVDDPAGVLLKWKAPNQNNFKIYRSSEKAPQPTPVGTSDKPQYVDETTSYGTKYEYYIQGVNGTLESEAAGPVSITPEDKFPPAVPSGLTATPGLNAIELAWERNTEGDFRGYRVYRALREGGGPLQRIADMVQAPNYSDRQIEAGKRYQYVISAVNQLGHESEKSAPVEVTAP